MPYPIRSSSASTLASMSRPAADVLVKLPKEKKDNKLIKRKRKGKYGETFIDRKFEHETMKYLFEPDWSQATTPSTATGKEHKLILKGINKTLITSTASDNSQELMIRYSLEQVFDSIYGFSDTEDNIDNLQANYKSIGTGFRGFLKQKKKLSTERNDKSFLEQ